MSGPTRPELETRLILVRHGSVQGIYPPAFRGRADLPLLAEGLEEAAAARDYVRQSGQAHVLYSSPLQRCVQTATIIGEAHGLQPELTPELVDIDYGRWQGVSYADLGDRDPAALEAWLSRPDQVEIPGGEALAALSARVAGWAEQAVHRHSGQTVIAVGHDTVNRVLLLHTLGLPLARFWRLGQDPCAINVLLHRPAAGWTVYSVNETGHLRSRAEATPIH